MKIIATRWSFCLGYGMLGLLDVQNVGYLGCLDCAMLFKVGLSRYSNFLPN